MRTNGSGAAATEPRPRFSAARDILPEDSLTRFMTEHGMLQTLARGETLEDSGAADHISYITKGWVIRRRTVDDEHRGIIGTYMRGDLLELDRLVEDKVADCLEALTDVECRTVPPLLLRKAIEADCNLAFPIMRRLVAESDWLREGLVAVGQLTAAHRLLIYIAQTRRRMIAFGNLNPAAKSMPFPLTQAQLADALGVSAIHANRTVAALRSDHGVTLRARTIWFDDLVGFEAETAQVMG